MIERYIGEAIWIALGEETEISRAILRSPDELALELTYERRHYSVTLHREGTGEFRGTYTVDGRRGGDARCKLAKTDEGEILLYGRWLEGGVNHTWCSRLNPVDDFDD
jgi:hypothetical protein